MDPRIELFIGPMFSNKTTQMFNRIKSFSYGNNSKKSIILKWDMDLRNGETQNIIKTHDGKEMSCIRVNKDLLLLNYDLLNEYGVIGIDEGHFFENLVVGCEKLCNEYNKIIIVTGLSGDFKREPFEEISKLIPKCDKIKNLTAVCTVCSKKASFSYKNDCGDQEKIIEVGGKEKYMPLCRQCYNNQKKLKIK